MTDEQRLAAQAQSIRSRWGISHKRGYATARTTPLTQSFGGSWGTADAELRFDLPTLRARSREMEQKSPVLQGFANAGLNNILGPKGINFQMKIITQSIAGDRTSGLPDKQANDIIETAWAEATNKTNYLVSADMNKRLADEVKLRRVFFDGEVFIRTFKPFENEPQLARMLIDPDLCDQDYNEAIMPGGGQIRMGVEMDKYGKRIAYHFLTQPKMDYQYGQRPPEKRIRIPASEIRHLFIPLRPGQTRGLPITAQAILSVRQLEAFIDAAVVNARIGAARNVYYTKQFPTGWTAADGLPPSYCDANGRDTGAIVDDLREGESLELPTGVEAKMLDTRFPDDSIDAFTKVAMRFNAMALGTSYMTLSNDLSQANFSSLRAGLNEERSLWARWQEWFIENECLPDFYEFLDWGLATQFIPLPETKRKKFNRPVFTGRRWSSVNPLQDIMADTSAIASLLKSPQECIRERGADPDEVLQEIKDFRDLADELGLNGEDTVLANKPNEGAGTTAGKAVAGEGVQATALTGAQVTALIEIVNEVAFGRVTKASAMAIIAASFPLVSEDIVDSIIASIKEGGASEEEIDNTDEAK